MVGGFIGVYCSTPPVVFVLDSPLNTCIFLLLCQHWHFKGQSTLITHSFELILHCPSGYVQTSVIKQFLCQFFRSCLIVSPNSLTECFVIIGSNVARSIITGSILNCTLLFNLCNTTFNSSNCDLSYTSNCCRRSFVVIPIM